MVWWGKCVVGKPGNPKRQWSEIGTILTSNYSTTRTPAPAVRVSCLVQWLRGTSSTTSSTSSTTSSTSSTTSSTSSTSTVVVVVVVLVRSTVGTGAYRRSA